MTTFSTAIVSDTLHGALVLSIFDFFAAPLWVLTFCSDSYNIITGKWGFGMTSQRGKLKIFLGYASGVGKTYSMLDAAQEKFRSGVDVVIGYLEPHAHPETMSRLTGLPILPPIEIRHRKGILKEFDLDAALIRKPELLIVDGLAHTNPEEKRNNKRYQDVEELLQAGISVYTTLNVQELENLQESIYQITGIIGKETIPNRVFDLADSVDMIDFSPEELLQRFQDGKICRTLSDGLEGGEDALETLRKLREITNRTAVDQSRAEKSGEAPRRELGKNKMMVCVSASPLSERTIRWAARTAETLHMSWVAVYVENSTMQNGALSVDEHLEVAKRLGAEVVRLRGENITATLAEYARISGVGSIVIGKNNPDSFRRRLLRKNIEDRLVRELPDVEIHIIAGTPESPAKRPVKSVLREQFPFSVRDLVKTMLLLGIATLLSQWLHGFAVGDQNIILVYILSVLIVARTTTGHLYSVFASIIAAYLFNYAFTAPYFSFNVTHPGYPITAAIMLLAAWITSTLTLRVKKQVRLSAEREHRTLLLFESSQQLLRASSQEEIIETTGAAISNIIQRFTVLYFDDPLFGGIGRYSSFQNPEESAVLEKQREKAVAHWVFINQKPAGCGTKHFNHAKATYFPVISRDAVLGVIGVSCASGKLDENSTLFLQMLASQLALAMERQQLADEQRRIVVASEKERMRSNLLRAISHDLRTPLTGIYGASSAILENGEKLDQTTHDQLLTDIKNDAQWLIRMVENLLSVTRINEDTMNVSKTLEAAEEIVAEAVLQIRKRYASRKVVVGLPNELVLVPMDATLIVQVLINLIENAMKHSQDHSAIEVYASVQGGFAVFEVSDNGVGISEEEFPFLFENGVPATMKSSDSSRGMGIGLSICTSIIKAHGGKIEAENRLEGGAVFRFWLPLEKGETHEPEPDGLDRRG